MINKISIVALFILMQQFLYSQIHIDTIKTVAKNFFAGRVQSFQPISEKDIFISEVFVFGNDHSNPDYYFKYVTQRICCCCKPLCLYSYNSL